MADRASVPADGAQFRLEADLIHRALFGAPAPDDLRQRYEELMRATLLAPAPAGDVAAALARGVDVEALELALRQRNPVNSVTQRVRAVSYLAEACPEHFRQFVNERPRFLRASVLLAWHLARSVCKGLKGRWLLRVHDLR